MTRYRCRVFRLLLVATLGQACSGGRAVREESTLRQAVEPTPFQVESKPDKALAELTASVRALPAGAREPAREEIVRAFLRLADALRLVHQYDDRVAALRGVAQRLKQASPSSAAQAEMVHEGLALVLRSLVSGTVPGDDADYQRAVETLRDALFLMNAERPLVEQGALVAAAFRTSTDAIFLTAGGEPPFHEASSFAEREDVAVGSVAAAVDNARSAVLELAQAEWMKSRPAAARALASLADLVTAADGDNQLGPKITTLRFQVTRLKNSDRMTLATAEWIKKGLLTALDALDELHSADEPIVAAWTRAARKAVANIEDKRFLTFQRGAVQDAFRATVGAFAAATTDRSRLPSESPSANR